MDSAIDQIIRERDLSKDIYHRLYEIMGCSPLHTTEEIKREYKKRILTCHPDKSSDESQITRENFQDLLLAYSILGDEENRKSYDEWRKAGLAIPFPKWRAGEIGAEHKILHWSNGNPRPLILNGNEEDNHDHEMQRSRTVSKALQDFRQQESKSRKSNSGKSNADLLEAFRSYEL